MDVDADSSSYSSSKSPPFEDEDDFLERRLFPVTPVASVRRRLFRAEPGLRAHIQLRELCFRFQFAWREHGSQIRGEEAERDANDTGIGEREGGGFGGVKAVFAKQDQDDRRGQTHAEAGDGSGGVEAFPED